MKTVDRNCLAYWFPLIRDAGLPVPKTEIVTTECELSRMLDGDTPDGFADFAAQLRIAANSIKYPFFLRTGHTSSKHNWARTCYVDSEEDLGQHVFQLVEFSNCCDLFGLPTNVWAVRELIPTTPAFHAFRGVPIVREFRVFTKDYKPACIHPYWPADTIRNPNTDDWEGKLAAMSLFSVGDATAFGKMASVAAAATDYGDWSIDFLQDKDGKWWLTDMAAAKRSFHHPECKEKGGA